MQEKIKKLNAFAEKDCNKCELRAACFLAKADWQKAKKDYPCFWATDGLVLDITNRYHNGKAEEKQRTIKLTPLKKNITTRGRKRQQKQ